MRNAASALGAAVALIGSVLPALSADPTAIPDENSFYERTRSSFVTIGAAQWAESRLPLLPYNTVTGKLKFDDEYIVTLGYGHVLTNNLWLGVPGTDFGLNGFSVEATGTMVKHFGKSEHWEAAAALVLRSPEWHIFGPLSTNVAIGNGFSYAFSDPKFEYGRHLVRGEDTVRFQYHISLENEWTHKDLPNVHLVGMLHHRSGMYGVVSPSKTGSNYIGAALRFDIQ